MDHSQWKIFSPVGINGVHIKNRFMRSAMCVVMADHQGCVTTDNLNWYRRAAEGGVGLLITEAMAVHPRGKMYPPQISAYGEERLPGLKQLADVIHEYGDGVVVMPQIHSGGAHDWGYTYGQEDAGLGLDVIIDEDINSIIEAFGESALLLKRAGFDGVQLHGGHGYLIAQFLSPAVNQRTDKWGGSEENRTRFPLEIFKAIRERVGEEFPIGIKMNTADYLKGGNWIDDTSNIAKRFATEGFDFIEMSGGMGFMIELREALRKKVKEKEFYFRDAIPKFKEAVRGTTTILAGCGGIRTPALMEELLTEGLDIISFGRPWLSEPDFANRIMAGDLRTARCVSTYRLCNLCLIKPALESSTCVKFYPGDCRMTCPIDQDNPAYFSLIAQKRFAEALAVVKSDNPLAGVLGRVCHHPCETICRGETGEPLTILGLKRFITDYGVKNSLMVTAGHSIQGDGRGKVAIIGSGPVGLTCGFYMAKKGYKPTIFEKLPVKGGLLATGIPRYRLPEDVVEADISYIESAGVEIKTGMALGEDFSISDLFEEKYLSVFISVGASRGLELDVEGRNLDNVFLGLDFLQDVNLKKPIRIGKRVLVIGGGNVGINAAMTALRLGAREVQLACLETREEMPAYENEIRHAVEEGIVLHPSRSPRMIRGNGAVTGVDFIRCTGVFDDQGRFDPRYDEGDELSLQADTVIIAIGQTLDAGLFDREKGIRLTPGGTIDVNPQTLETSLSGVFAGGDAATGPKNVVEAVAAGKNAAESIARFLQGRSIVRPGKDDAYDPFLKIIRPSAFADPSERTLGENSLRAKPPELPVAERTGNFNEIVGVLSEEEAVREAKRCLKYDLELEEKSAKRFAHMGKATFVLES